MMKHKTKGIMILSMIVLVNAGCKTAPDTEASRDTLETQVEQAIAAFKSKDPGIDKFFQESYGYAILPKVVKGAFIVGGGHGQGHVYEQGGLIGYCSLSQASIGASIGGETFREIIFFENAEALKVFCAGEFTFSAQVTAVAVSAGAALKAKYNNGMAIFMMLDKGMMADASAGGQNFKYVAK